VPHERNSIEKRCDMTRLILFLVRLKLGVRKDEHFRFANQSSNATYSINDKGVWKFWWHSGLCSKSSNVSLNWLMNKECKIERIGHGGE